MLAPILLAGSHRTLIGGASTTGQIFAPWHLFWFLGESGHVVIGGNGLPKPAGYRVPPEWLSPLTHPLIALLVVPLSLLWARVHRAMPRFGGENVLLLLALLFLLRCVLDPWNAVYYELPFVLALLSWEVLCSPAAPAGARADRKRRRLVHVRDRAALVQPRYAMRRLSRVVAAACGLACARGIRGRLAHAPAVRGRGHPLRDPGA